MVSEHLWLLLTGLRKGELTMSRNWAGLLYVGLVATTLAGVSCSRGRPPKPVVQGAPQAVNDAPGSGPDAPSGIGENSGSETVSLDQALEQLELETDSGAAAVIPRPASASNSEVERELQHVDPTLDGWDTERFNDLAMAQLKNLAKKVLANATVEALADDDFTSAGLRPADAKRVYSDRQMQVMRWSAPIEPASAPQKYRGRAGFQQAVQETLQSWRDVEERPRLAFKIVRVSTKPTEAVTRVRAEISGSTTQGFAQQNATWLCRWRWPQASAAPLLTAITLERFEEVEARIGGGRLFTDATWQTLGRNESFAEQFHRGIDYWRDRLDWRLGLDVAGPHGLAVGDVNGDGLDDVFVCEPGGLPNRLYLQQSDGTALDVSQAGRC